MQISSNGLDFIKDWEKLRLKAYIDSGGKITIGYGATTYESGAAVKMGDVITEPRALQLLAFHAGSAAAAVNNRIKAALTQGQFDALVSFAFNVGNTAFTKSTLAVVVSTNPNDNEAVEGQFRRWVYDHGKFVRGLLKRRNGEIDL
jgi:lysozyme